MVEFTASDRLSHCVNEEEAYGADERKFKNGAVLRHKESFGAFSDRISNILHRASASIIIKDLA